MIEAAAGSKVTPVASRKLPPMPGVPVYAQRAGPWIEQPEGAPPPNSRFCRLNPTN